MFCSRSPGTSRRQHARSCHSSRGKARPRWLERAAQLTLPKIDTEETVSRPDAGSDKVLSERLQTLLWKTLLETASRSTCCSTRQAAETLMMPSLDLPRHAWLLQVAAATRRVFPLAPEVCSTCQETRSPGDKARRYNTIVAERLIKVLSRCILDELAGVRVHPSPHAGMGFWLEDVSACLAPAGQHRFTLHLLVPGLDTSMSNSIAQHLMASDRINNQPDRAALIRATAAAPDATADELGGVAGLPLRAPSTATPAAAADAAVAGLHCSAPGSALTPAVSASASCEDLVSGTPQSGAHSTCIDTDLGADARTSCGGASSVLCSDSEHSDAASGSGVCDPPVKAATAAAARGKAPLHARARLLSSSSGCSDVEDLQQLQPGGVAAAGTAAAALKWGQAAAKKQGAKALGWKGLLRGLLQVTCFGGVPAT